MVKLIHMRGYDMLKKNRTNICRLAGALLALALCVSLVPGSTFAADGTEEKDDSKIVIVHTNDVHCSINASEDDLTVGYAGLATVVKEMESLYANVTVADAGDSIQGGSIGSLTQGSAIIELMNEVGYDVATLGNHEFDYGMDDLKKRINEADYPYVCCNFTDINGQAVLNPYFIETYETSAGQINVAYVGAVTPETLTKSNPSNFKDEDGNYIYDFCRGNNGQDLYDAIQASVDSARAAGADYVILVGHLGQTGITSCWRSDIVCANTTGIDAIIDGHSHETYEQTCSNKDGESVPISQCGSMLSSVGVMTIDLETGTITDEQIQSPVEQDPDMLSNVEEVNEEFNEILSENVAQSSVDLRVHKTDGSDDWLIRTQETNMGDLLADAYRIVLGADIGIVNAGGCRNDINKGAVTYGDLLSVQPFGNDTAVVRVTGQQLLDALEVGARLYPEYSGGLLQISGASYEIHTDVPSSVVMDDANNFIRVDGEYRVKNVMVNGKALDLNGTYTVGSIYFLLRSGGDGMNMFSDAEIVVDGGPKDIDIFAEYVTENLGGVIGEEYADINGQGRIKLVSGEEPATSETTAASSQTTAPTGTSGTTAGTTARTAATAATTKSSSSQVKTGDQSQIYVWAALIVLCGAIIASVEIIRRKSK